MRKNILFIACLLLVLLVSSLGAQEAVYSLHEPSFEEFFAELTRMDMEEGFDPVTSEASYTAAIEAQVRYVAADVLEIPQLEALYDFFARAFEPEGLFYSTRYTQSELSTLWLQQLIQSQLPDDVDGITEKTEFGPFTVKWRPHNFAAVTPGGVGYRLDMYRDGVYLQTLLLEVVEDTAHLVDMPIMPMRIGLEVIETQREPGGNLWGYIEITGFTNRIHMGRLVVLRSWGAELELVASMGYDEPPGTFPPLYNDFTFMSTGDTHTRNIQHYRRLFDSWDCPVTQVDFYTFDAEQGQYVPDSPKSEFLLPDNMDCFLRQADQAMASERYLQAIDLYERAIALEAETRDPGTEPSEVFTYYQARLVLAYLLTNQPEQASALVAQIPDYEDSFSQAIVDALQDNANAVAVCQAAYDFVLENPSGFTQMDRGNTSDGIFHGPYMGSPLYVESVACNLAPW